MCQVWLKLTQSSPDRALHLNKLESPSHKDALCQVGLKKAQWFWRRRFFNFVNVFSLFRNYLFLEEGGALHWNKLESPSPKDALCQVWMKLAQWFWRRRFFSVVNVFSLFRNYLPLEKSGALHLNKLECPLPKDALCQVWLKWPGGSGEEDENVKSLQTDGRTDRQTDRRKVIRKANLSFQL